MQIDIGSVLTRFDDIVDDAQVVKNHGIKFITSDGRLRTFTGRKHVRTPARGLRQPLQSRGKVMFNLKYNGTLLLHEAETEQPRAVKVATITHFRAHNSNQWLTVFH